MTVQTVDSPNAKRKTCRRYDEPEHAHSLTFSRYRRQVFLTRPRTRAMARRISLAMLVAVTGSCRKDESEQVKVPNGVVEELRDPLPQYLVVPTYEGRLLKSQSYRYQGRTSVSYNLGRTYPAAEFIVAVCEHLASLGWSQLDYSVSDPQLKVRKEHDWYAIAPGQIVDLYYDRWWARGAEVIELRLARRNEPGTPRHHLVQAKLTHYNGEAVASRYPYYSHEKSQPADEAAKSYPPED